MVSPRVRPRSDCERNQLVGMVRAMNNSTIRRSAVALATTALLLLPGAAFAREGAASGGNKTTPAFAAECGVITPTNSPQRFKTATAVRTPHRRFQRGIRRPDRCYAEHERGPHSRNDLV